MSEVQHQPTLPEFGAERFRRALAGLIDDEASPEWRDDFRDAGAALCFVLARFYNRDELDAVKLWERIGTAVVTACEQVDDGDLDRLFTLALATVKASPSQVAASEEAWILGTMAEREESWRLGLIRYLKAHSYTVLIHGRRRWEEFKGDASRLRVNRSQKGGAA